MAEDCTEAGYVKIYRSALSCERLFEEKIDEMLTFSEI